MTTYLATNDAGSTALGFALWIGIIIAYWAPTLVAWRRHVPNLTSVAIINGLLGWTFVGWVVALAWSVKDVPRPEQEPKP